MRGQLEGGRHPWSVADTLDCCRDHLAPPLVTDMALLRLQATAARLPAALTRHVYLECRLHPRADRVDLIAGVDVDARAVLAGTQPWGRWWNGRGATAPVWDRVSELSSAWLSELSPVAAGIGRVWLEFDQRARRSGVDMEPGVFVELKRSAIDGGVVRWLAVVSAAVRPLLGGEIAFNLRRRLMACASALPGAATIPYIGVFPARSSVDLRVCAAGMSAAEVPRYLAAVGWSGNAASARRMLAVAQPDRPVIVNLDVGASVGARLGIELMLPRRDQHRGALGGGGRASAILATAVENGWADATKVASLHQFPGRAVSWLEHELWPSRIERRVNHVKLVVREDGLIGAKVYLHMHHVPSAMCAPPLFNRKGPLGGAAFGKALRT